MKKFGKFVCFTAVTTAIVGGITYLMKKDKLKVEIEQEDENGDTFEEDLKDLFDDFKEEAKEKAGEVKDAVKEKVNCAADTAQDVAGGLKEKACDAKEDLQENMEEMKDKANAVSKTSEAFSPPMFFRCFKPFLPLLLSPVLCSRTAPAHPVS